MRGWAGVLHMKPVHTGLRDCMPSCTKPLPLSPCRAPPDQPVQARLGRTPVIPVGMLGSLEAEWGSKEFAAIRR